MEKLHHRLNIALIILILALSALVGTSFGNKILQSGTPLVIHSTNNNELGQMWHHLSMPVRANWKDVILGNNRFVAIADDISQVAVSYDGIVWTMHDIIPNNHKHRLQAIAYGNNMFYAIGRNGSTDIGYYSYDGISWATLSLNENVKLNYNSVVFGVNPDNRASFVSIANDKINEVFYHNQEFDKHTNTYELKQPGFVDIAYSNHNKFWVGISNNFALTKIGSNIRYTPLPLSNTWTGIASSTAGIVAVANSGNIRAMHSNDGLNWQLINVPLNNWSTVRWTGRMFVAVAYNSTTISSVMTSMDGINWTSQRSPSASWQAVSGYYTVNDSIERIVALSNNHQDGMGLMISDVNLVQIDARFDSTTTQDGANIIVNNKQVSDNAQTVINNKLKGLSYTINKPSSFDKITINDKIVAIGTGATDNITYKITQHQSDSMFRLDLELIVYNTTKVEIVVYTRHIVTVRVPEYIITKDGNTSKDYTVNNSSSLSTSDLHNWINQVDGNRIDDFSVLVDKSYTLDLQPNPTQQQAPEFVDQKIVKQIDDIGTKFVPKVQGGYGPGALEYRSDNHSVATINHTTGEVTIVGRGKASIYVYKQATIGWLQSKESSAKMLVDINTQDAPIFDHSQYYKFLGDPEFRLNLTLSPSGTFDLVWTSMNTAIIDVDHSGLINIRGIGTTRVSVYRKGNDIYANSEKSYATIIVSNSHKSPQTTPKMQYSVLDLQYGDEYQLEATGGESTGGLIYAANNNIVSIEQLSGKLKAMSVGQTTISVYRQGDDTYLDSDKAYITIIVSKADQYITIQNLNIDIHIKLITLDLSVSGGSGIGTFSYVSRDDNTATVDHNGRIMINSTGQVEIVVFKLGDYNYNDSNVLILRLNVYDDTPLGSWIWLWLFLIIPIVLVLIVAISSISKRRANRKLSTQSNTKNNSTKSYNYNTNPKRRSTVQYTIRSTQSKQKNDKK